MSMMASAIGMALLGAGISPDVLAATSSASVSESVASVEASTTGRYIVTFSEAGLVSYKGGVAGLQRTAPVLDGVSINSSRKFDVNSSASQSYKSYLADQRAAHVSTIEQKLGRALAIHFTYDVTRNAVSVEMSKEEAELVAHLDGVASVTAVGTKETTTFRGPTFIGANTIWDGTQVPSYATATRGQGVKVGVIDTGTFRGHPSFTNDATCGFSEASPKLHPRDCNTNNGSTCTGTSPDAAAGQGHGVHTSSTAAGNTIDNTVTPAPLLPDGVKMSGVAPCAELYTYRVANASGGISDDAITAAIQNAIVDQLDVVNFSIGPTCGGGNPWQDSTDFLQAESADIFVAASAGNTRATCTNPTGLVANNGPWMLTVAASTQDQILAPALKVTGPGTPPANIQTIPVVPGSKTVVNNTTALSNYPLKVYAQNLSGCNDTGGIPAHYFDNSIAVVRRGFQAPGTTACSFVEKITNAGNAGATMVIIANNRDENISMDAGTTTTPAFSISTLAESDALIAFIRANQGTAPAADTIFADGFELAVGAVGDYIRGAIFPTQGDVLGGFSFRGPTQAPYDNLTKPDITGPGVNIYAAFDAASGNYGLDSGTSMSSPHLAGSAALVRAVQPTWSPMEVKSALQTTATLTGLSDDATTPWTPDEVGSGRVDLSKATRAGLTLDETVANFTAANPNGGSISQKQLNLASLRDTACNTPCTWTRTFKNRLHSTGSWSVSAVDPSGYHVTASPATFSLAQDATQVVTFTATATGSAPTTLSYGRVDLHETGNQSPDQHLTVAVKAGSVTPPAGYCTGGVCNLQVDVLSGNFSGIGCASYCGLLWLNRFSPEANEYPITLTKIQTIFGAGAGWNATGDHINIYVYQDSDNDPSNGATLVGSYKGYTMPAPANAMTTITLPTPIVVNGPGDVIIALTNPAGNTGLRPAAADTGPYADRSWIADYADTVAGVAPDLAAVGLAKNPDAISGFQGNWIIRAQGTNGGGRPVTLEPVAK